MREGRQRPGVAADAVLRKVVLLELESAER